MARWTVERVPRRWPFPPWGGLVVLLWLGLVGVFELLAPQGELTLCHLRRLTGLPCPTCGTTRAVLALARGQFAAAFGQNPFMVSAALLGGVWLLVRIGLGRTITLELPGGRRLVWAAIGAAFLANWAYLLARHGG